MTATGSVTSAEIYAGYVEQWLRREHELAQALEARGAFVITSAGVLVTLLIGLVGVIGEEAELLRAGAGRPGLVIACVLFALASLSAVGIVMPQPHADLDPEAVLDELRSGWDDPPEVAVSRTTADRLSAVAALHRSNARKGGLLMLATTSVSGAIIALAATVVLLMVQ